MRRCLSRADICILNLRLVIINHFSDLHEMKQKMASARIIITHCVSSTVMQAIQLARCPSSFPGRKVTMNMLDDHQVLFAGYLEEKEKVIVVTEYQRFRNN